MTESTFRLVQRVVFAVGCVALTLHLAGLRREPVQLDEFEHLHSAWLVSNGQTPYTDFFQHHTPLFYYLGASVLSRFSPSFDTILNMRLLPLGFSVCLTACGWLWLGGFGRIHGLLAVCLMATSATLLTMGHTIFLDTFSAPFLVLSAMLIAGGRHRPSWMLGAGISFGLAVLFNLKASMAVFAPMVLMASRGWEARCETGLLRAWAKDIAAYLAGGLISIAFVVALLGKDGTVGMWQYTVALNLGWKARQSGVPWLLGMFWRDAFVCFSAMALILARVWTLPKRRFALEERDVPWLFLASLIGGLFILPVVWSEYFAIVAPFMALTGALALGDWYSAWDRPGSFAESWWGRRSAYALWFFALLALFPYRAIFRADPLAYAQSAIMLALFGILSVAVSRARRREAWMPLAVGLALITIVPLVRVGTTLPRLGNNDQRERVEYLLANTRPGDAVFDGYTGYGVFRPHAYYFWFLHEEVQAMLPESDKNSRLLAALEITRPAIAITDSWVATLPPQVQTYLANNYEGTTPFAVLKKRKNPLANAATRR